MTTIPINNKEISYIETRFGKVASAYAQNIFFEKGITGFSEFKNFFLINSVFKNFPNFALLQAVDDSALSFILYPLGKEEIDNFFAQDLLNDICSELKLNRNKLAIFLVVNIKIIANEQKIFVNNKAPILLNSEEFSATQYIISNKNYEIRRELLLSSL